MKNIICILVILFVSSFLFSAGIPIAIMDIEPIAIPGTKAVTVSELLRVEFVKHPFFNVVERNDLVKILSEQELQLSGLTDAGQAVEVGKMLNVKKILLGSMAKFDGKFVSYVLNLRLVDVETGSVEIAESIDIANDDELRNACTSIASKISQHIKIVGEIALIEDESIYINLGSDVGIHEGDILEAFAVNLVKDKQGRILLREEEIKARLRVITADTEGSKCNVTWKRGGSKLTEKMSIRRKTGDVKDEEPKKETSVTFKSMPEGAKAYIDGEFVGITPVVLNDFKPGKYKAEMRYPGHRAYAGKINLTEGRQITLERELEKLVEVEDMMEGGVIPRKTTDPDTALTWSFLPGAGQFYNKYETTGLGISLSIFTGTMGTLLFTNTLMNDLNDKESGDQDEFYGYVWDTKVAGGGIKVAIMGGYVLLTYLASILESRLEASSPYKYTEYTEIKFGALGSYVNSSQFPSKFTDGSTDYQNSALDEKTSDMSSFIFGGFLSAGIRSRNFDTALELSFTPEVTIMGAIGRIKIPLLDTLDVSLGCTLLINLNDTQEIEYAEEDPVSYFGDLITPTIGLSYETSSLLFILEGSPFAFGAADFFYTSNPGDNWTDDLNLNSLLGFYVRGRVDVFFNARLGVSLEGRYIGFYGLLNQEAENAGLPVFDYHNTVFVTLAPVFRF
ncbi:MAG: PEGA domain-containing protein [Spirochaetales bacterium]|nr:PEGA domain-containing protein [Spirochaetales bacterium]